MNCQKAEKQILLHESGELGPRREKSLATHLERCADCRAFRLALTETAQECGVAFEPGEKVLQNIRREARILAPAHKRPPVFYWKPAMAIAASVLIGLGAFFSAFRPDTVGLELVLSDTQLLDTEDQVVSIMYDGLTEDDLVFNFLMTYEES
jgi:hypothetical protein